MTRPVHYRGSGLAFECYWKELQRHLDSRYEVPSKAGHFMVRKYTEPNPRKHSSLREVTCRECWRRIRVMAERHDG